MFAGIDNSPSQYVQEILRIDFHEEERAEHEKDRARQHHNFKIGPAEVLGIRFGAYDRVKIAVDDVAGY
jgi:hypothetical protein